MSVATSNRHSEGVGMAVRSVLVVDDEPTMRVALVESIRRNGYGVMQATDGYEALECLEDCKPWLVLTDMKMPRMGGLEVIREIRKRSPQSFIVVMTAYGKVDAAVEAMKCGATDFLEKPFATERLEQVLASLEPASPMEPQPVRHSHKVERPILTQDPTMQRLLDTAEDIAGSSATILIHGESGTGKELLARFIHQRSPRTSHPFIAVNCAALPDGLLESELFGHERGAFTGALVRKVGKFEMAHQGTLLLDEISEMNLGLQAKLLRVLQEREVDRLGGKETIPVNIRVISTTNRSLRREVDHGRFRGDLFYRLNVFPLVLPLLRERPMDIALLARTFVKEAGLRNGLPAPRISDEAMYLLESNPWKGNVRELENAVERAVLLAKGHTIEPEHFPADDMHALPEPLAFHPSTSSGGEGSLWNMEREVIFRTLGKVKGNRTHAAKELGISIRTLRNKLREYRELSGRDGSTGPLQERDHVEGTA